jgi:hypothetical protein
MIEWPQYTRAFASSISNERGWTSRITFDGIVSNSDEREFPFFNVALIDLDYSDFGV